jgi:hypothetical protein
MAKTTNDEESITLLAIYFAGIIFNKMSDHFYRASDAEFEEHCARLIAAIPNALAHKVVQERLMNGDLKTAAQIRVAMLDVATR